VWRACLLLFMLSLCPGARAQQACPWLTQGTAAGLMGGDVSASVHVSAGEGTCEFVRAVGGDHPGAGSKSSLHLRIVVSHLPPPECARGERLTGIGQDAALCRTDAKGEHHEIIVGRVRTTHFVLTLTAREASASHEASFRGSLEQAAEEVSGNLF
jgi:hypothetical protein